MRPVLSPERERDFLARGFSRRDLFRVATLAAGAATLPFYGEAALAQLSKLGPLPPDAVKINSNENPLGPCPEALAAVMEIVKEGGRYHYELTDELSALIAAQDNVAVEQVAAFPGSSAPLTQAVLAFTSPEKSYVTADPGYEAGERAAKFIGAKTIRVPLAKDFAHDVRAMASADPNAGMIYICNPNNPTGSCTSDEDIDWLVDHLPKGAVMLLDEAYAHVAGCRMRSDLVAAGKPVVILRTFSKIYGMAGLRAGAAIGQPEHLARINEFSSGALPITGVVAAMASLKNSELVPTRRKIIADTRAETFDFLERHGFSYVPSVSNKFMVDVKQPGERVMLALRTEKVYIGRVWPSWPTHVRVSIGTPDEMRRFQAAFLKVMAALG